MLLLGGTPYPDEIHMWWNFVAGSRDEITEACRAWEAHSGRFPDVGSVLPRVPAPRPPWLARA